MAAGNAGGQCNANVGRAAGQVGDDSSTALQVSAAFVRSASHRPARGAHQALSDSDSDSIQGRRHAPSDTVNYCYRPMATKPKQASKACFEFLGRTSVPLHTRALVK